LIITCQECSTSFQLDDARIPAAGARVRCSRCKHAFFLPNPSTSQSEAVQAVVEQTIQGQAGRAPEPARDLAAGRHDAEEEEWQFSEEIRVAGDDDAEEADAAQAGSPRADSFDLTGDFGRGFDPDAAVHEPPARALPSPTTTFEPAPGAAPAKATAPAKAAGAASTRSAESTPTRDDSSFGSIDDFSSLIEDDDVSIDLATPPPTAAATRAAGRAQPAAETRSRPEDLGDPESWDLVGGDARRPAKPGSAARSGPSPAAAKRVASAAPLDLFGDGELPPVREDPVEASAVGRWLAPLGRLLGSGLTLVCVGVVAALWLRPEWTRWAEVPQRIEQGALVAEAGRGGWLETSRAGFLLVYAGELRNTGNRPVAPAPVQLALLDRDGVRLDAPPVRAGRPLAEATLRESDPAALAAELQRSIAALNATPLAPGEVRPFSAVVPAEALPEAAWRVRLESGSGGAGGSTP